MLNNETIDFLKVINKMSNTVILRYPQTVGISEQKDLVYSFNLDNIDQDGFDKELGIFNLSSFLNMFNLFGPDREITLNDKYIEVKDKNTSIKYILQNINVISQYDAKPEQFNITESFPSVLEFELTQDMIKKIKTASSCFNELDTVLINGSDESYISLVTNDSRLSNSTSNTVKFNLNKSAEKNFEVAINVQTLSKLPTTDYCVKIKTKFNEKTQKHQYRILLESKTLKNFKIILPVLITR